MASISEREQRQVDAANTSGRTPVVFIHGLWVLASSWDNWAGCSRRTATRRCSRSGPTTPSTVEEANANPDVMAGKTLKQSPTTPPR